MLDKLEINSSLELFSYLADIKEYVNAILLFHNGYEYLDIKEILMYLSCVNEIIDSIEIYLKKCL